MVTNSQEVSKTVEGAASFGPRISAYEFKVDEKSLETLAENLSVVVIDTKEP